MLDIIASATTQVVIGHPDEPTFTLITFAAAEGHTFEFPFGQPTGRACRMTNTYITRFGDECCGNCHVTLRWSPQWVREGLYGSDEDTNAWTQATLDCLVARFLRAEGLEPVPVLA
jgi:hypothetical protein